jgi:hypothetical protein
MKTRNFSLVLCAPASEAGGESGAGAIDNGGGVYTESGAAPAGEGAAPNDGGVASPGGNGDAAAPGEGAAAPAGGQAAAQPGAGQQTSPAAQQPQVLKLDQETIAALRAQSAPAPQPQQQPQLDQAALDKLLNPVRVTPELMKSLGFDAATPEQIQGFQNFSNAIVKNAVSVASLMLQRRAEQFTQQLEPIMQHYQQQQAAQTESEFYSTYPQLKNYSALVKAAARQISSTKADGTEKSAKDVFAEISQTVMDTLKASGINLPASANHSAGSGAPQGGQGTQVPAANGVAGPGRSATGGAGGKPNNPDRSIYD